MYSLTAQMKEILDQYTDLGVPSITSVDAQTARQLPTLSDAVLGVLSNHITKRISGPIEPVGKVDHKTIRGPVGDILLRIYTPEGEGPFPVLVYFHGGGWVIANLDTYDSSCRALTNAAEFVVVSVAYRQAPENKYPAAVEDAYCAYKWIVNNAATINGNPNYVTVGGESAGGNLAAVVCLKARDENFRIPDHQLLIYPVTNFAFTSPSYKEFENARPLNKVMMQWFWDQYLRTPADGAEPYASPLKAQLKGLPPATVINAAVDPLCNEGEDYADKLSLSGVDVRKERFDGVTHEFFGMGALLPEAKQAVKLAAARLRSAVESQNRYPTEKVDTFIPGVDHIY